MSVARVSLNCWPMIFGEDQSAVTSAVHDPVHQGRWASESEIASSGQRWSRRLSAKFNRTIAAGYDAIRQRNARGLSRASRLLELPKACCSFDLASCHLFGNDADEARMPHGDDRVEFLDRGALQRHQPLAYTRNDCDSLVIFGMIFPTTTLVRWQLTFAFTAALPKFAWQPLAAAVPGTRTMAATNATTTIGTSFLNIGLAPVLLSEDLDRVTDRRPLVANRVVTSDHYPEQRVGVERPRLETGGSQLGFGGRQLEPDYIRGRRSPEEGGRWGCSGRAAEYCGEQHDCRHYR